MAKATASFVPLLVVLLVIYFRRSVNEKNFIQPSIEVKQHFYSIDLFLESSNSTVITDDVIYLFTQLSSILIPFATTALQKQHFKNLKTLLTKYKNPWKHSLESWINEVVLLEVFDLNHATYLSLLVLEIKEVHSILQSHLLQVLNLLVATLLKQTESKRKSSDLCIKCCKLCLQLFRTFKDCIVEAVSNCFDDETKQCFASVAESCFNLLHSLKNDCLTASKFCSSVIAHMLSYHDSIMQSHHVVENFLSKDDDNQAVEIMPGVFVRTIKNGYRLDFWLVYGILSCFPRLLFHELGSSQLTNKSFFVIMDVCNTDMELQFQGFTGLQLWFKHLLNSSCSAKLVNESHVSMALDLVKNNWDSQVTGAVDILLEIFGSILDVLAANRPYVCKIVEHLLKVPNHVKGRYGPLCLCIRKFGYKTVLEMEPLFTHNIISSLGINHLASSVARVYKAIAHSAFKKNEQLFDVLKWENILGQPLVEALLNGSSLIQQNALSYLVPVNIELDGSVLPKLLHCISSSTSEDALVVTDDAKLAAVIGVIKVARASGKISLDNVELKLVRQAFTSHHNEIRANAFWVICKGPKKSDLILQEELSFLYEQIPLNMNIDCTAFRHELISCMNTMLERVQCSVVASLKQNNDDYVQMCMKFLSWLIGLSLDSIHVCFTYQKKITGLCIFKLLVKYFSFDGKASVKKKLSEKETTILQKALHQCGINLLSESNAFGLLQLVEDVVPEIRELSLHLLADCFPFPIVVAFNNSIENTFQSLLNSPKAQDTESGSLLVRFYFLHFLPNSTSEQSFDHTKSDFADINFNVQFLFVEKLLTRIEKNLSCFNGNFLDAAYHNPLHGWLLALSVCFESFRCSEFVLSDFSDKLWSFLTRANTTLSKVAHFFLGRVFSCSSGASNQYSASSDFREMSNRICKIICDSNDERIMLEEDVLLSQDFEIILSASWLALKNCFLCLSSIGCFYLRCNFSRRFSVEQFEAQLRKISSLFVTVLSMCRHRGAIESCYSSFVTYLTSLFNSVSYCSIADVLLTRLLQSQHQRHTSGQLIEGGSITRRSAGIPFVIDAILSANVAANKGSSMLCDCVETLQTSLVYLRELDENVVCVSADLPQVDALYILKSIFQNNKLGPLLGGQLPSVFVATLECLSSSLWIVRNAATCLLGILSSRMLGQQHIEKKFTNSLTASEFFARYPKLLSYFQQIFKSGIKISFEAQKFSDGSHYFLKPAIYPILCLLSKLAFEVNGFVSSNDLDLSLIIAASEELLTCRFLFVRTVTAEMLMSLCSADHVIEMICRYFSSLPTSLPENFFIRQNELNGWLHQTLVLLEKSANLLPAQLTKLCRSILRRKWLSVLRHNNCSCTAAMYLDVVVYFIKRKIAENFHIDSNQLLSGINCDNSLNKLVGYDDYVAAIIKYYVILEDLEMLKKLLALDRNASHLLCHKLCFEQLTKSELLLNKYGSCFIDFVTDHWRSQNKPKDVAAEKAAFQLLVKLRQFDRTDKSKRDQLSTLSKHVFSSSGTNLSLKCLKIKAMSWIIIWQIKFGTTSTEILQHICIWVNELCANTFITKVPEPLRLSAAKSLDECGTDILDWVRNLSMNNEKLKEESLKIAAYLCQSSLYLLHDEQCEIRESACGFVSALQIEQKVSKLQHNVATKVLLTYFVTEFPSLQLLDVFLAVCTQVTAPLPCSKQGLFQQETFNLYVQFEQLAIEVQEYAKEVITKIDNIPAEWITNCLKISDKLCTTINDSGDSGWNQLFRYGICSLVHIDITLYVAKAYSHKLTDHSFIVIIRDNLPLLKTSGSIRRLVAEIQANYF